MDVERRIAFLGASGTGKTTLANYIRAMYDMRFVSGSFSDLVPKTKDVKHVDMLNKSKGDIIREEFELLNIRKRTYDEKLLNHESFVTDRSPIDNMAYYIYKLSHQLDQCDMEEFFNVTCMVLGKYITHLIYIPFVDEMIDDWQTEDNGKRITNNYFQWQISQIMSGLIRLYGYQRNPTFFWDDKWYNHGVLNIPTPHGYQVKVLILDSPDIVIREAYIDRWLRK